MGLRRNPGRVAGFLCLLLIVLRPLRLIYILNTTTNCAASATRAINHEL